MALSDHGQYSGVVDIARNGIDEVIRLQTQIKQDEALIRQMLEALEKVDQAMPFPVARQEITAARARLAPVLHSTGKKPS